MSDKNKKIVPSKKNQIDFSERIIWQHEIKSSETIHRRLSKANEQESCTSTDSSTRLKLLHNKQVATELRNGHNEEKIGLAAVSTTHQKLSKANEKYSCTSTDSSTGLKLLHNKQVATELRNGHNEKKIGLASISATHQRLSKANEKYSCTSTDSSTILKLLHNKQVATDLRNGHNEEKIGLAAVSNTFPTIGTSAVKTAAIAGTSRANITRLKTSESLRKLRNDFFKNPTTHQSQQSSHWKPSSQLPNRPQSFKVNDPKIIANTPFKLIEHKRVEPKKSVTNKKLGPAKYFIINNWNFDKIGKDQPNVRKGSIKDVGSLKHTFEILNMKGEIHEDLSLKKLKELMGKISVEDFSENSAIVIVIMTHGGTSSTLFAKDDVFCHNDIIDPLLRNKDLEDKPKLIFIEACKGENDPRMSYSTNNSGSNMLIFYAAFENFVSYTHEEYGSYFTQSLCDKLVHMGKYKNIRDICYDVIDDVLKKCGKIQTPTLLVNLTKRYCFGDYI